MDSNTIYVNDKSFGPFEKSKRQKHDFDYQINIHGYDPKEIKFGIEENKIVLQAKHKEHRDKNNEEVSRQFERRVSIPEDIDRNSITWHVNDECHLEICGNKKKKRETSPKHQVHSKNSQDESSQTQILTLDHANTSRNHTENHPHYMKTIPEIFEHTHEKLHHNYGKGGGKEHKGDLLTNGTFSRVPFGLEK